MTNDFSSGQAVELLELLAHRDRKQAIQQALFEQFPTATLVMLSLNIPGPIKNNDLIQEIFEMGQEALGKTLTQKGYLWEGYRVINETSGLESYRCLKQAPLTVKQLTVDIEETHPLGRYFDMDVLWQDENKQFQLVSRKELSLPGRQCLICDKPAKMCARQRTHRLEELYEQISRDYKREKAVKR